MTSFLFRKELNERKARNAVRLEKILRRDPGDLGDIEVNKRKAERIRQEALRRNR